MGKVIEHSHEEVYGQWAGNNRGNKADLERCIKEVWPDGVWHSAQCRRKLGHGPEGMYCKQHGKMVGSEA